MFNSIFGELGRLAWIDLLQHIYNFEYNLKYQKVKLLF